MPSKRHVELFEETIHSLLLETHTPSSYKFCISGKYNEECIVLLKTLIPSAFIINNKSCIKQYEGFLLIQQSYRDIDIPKFVILMDGDDLVSPDRTIEMYNYAKKYNKAIITIVAKFNDGESNTDYDETIEDILPMAIDNGFIEPIDSNVYKVNMPFVSSEETSTMIIPYNIFSSYLTTSIDLKDNYADTIFYSYLMLCVFDNLRIN